MSIAATPYLVDFIQSGTGVTFCQGTFIAPFIILTAAQCLLKVDLDDVTLFNGNGVKRAVGAGDVPVLHESYRKRLHRHDIGLLLLAKGVPELESAVMVKSRRDAPCELGSLQFQAI